MSNNPLPLPLNIDAVTVDLKIPEEVTIKKSLILTPVFTSNPLFGEIDAVAEPLAILNASPVNAERGILNNPAPSPVNEPETDPVICIARSEPVISREPVMSTLPVNSEPNSEDSTLNPY